ncbi:hypothetical protein [Absidia glauca]|uniref:RRM domain-containing protein n=1 Tax=Absidia glauca TaxID=4829 RepID=A0A163MSY6_ABSGL|nr:hypothetical protein [Absidia glauca]
MASRNHASLPVTRPQQPTILIVKRIPPSLPPTKQHDFFTKYGASKVRPMQGKKMASLAFLDFDTRDQAQLAYQKLDKLYIDSTARKGLSVEYATHDSTESTDLPETAQAPPVLPFDPAPVAAELGFKYASNPQLLYSYPTPTPDIMNNMMNAIATVPRLYTQVLHLMNKMNLPPPFGLPSPAATPSLLKRKRDELLASDESEIEADEQDDAQERKLQLRRMTGQQQRRILRKS